MAEHKVDGGTMLLFIDPSGGTNYDTVVCLTSVGQAMSVQPVDASSACGPDKSPGAIDISYTFEGQHLQDPITGQISGTDLRLLLMAEQTVGWKLSPETPVAGDEIQEGTGYLSELSSTYAFDSVGVFTGTLQPYGVPTISVINPTPPSPPLFSIRLNVPASGNIVIGEILSSTPFDATIDWGDGNIYYHINSSVLNLTNLYNAPGTYLVTIDITNPVNVPIYWIDPLYDCSIDNLYNLNLLNFVTIEFTNNTGIGIFNNPPDFSTFNGIGIGLENYNYGNNNIILPTNSNTITFLNFNYGKLTSSQVNDILATVVNYNTVGQLDLQFQSPPAPPTGNGIFDKAILIQNGWTVNTD